VKVVLGLGLVAATEGVVVDEGEGEVEGDRRLQVVKEDGDAQTTGALPAALNQAAHARVEVRSGSPMSEQLMGRISDVAAQNFVLKLSFAVAFTKQLDS
jgi:hypothetical protein